MELTNESYVNLIEDLKGTDINGCVTGSSLWCYDTDITAWGADVDVFCYNLHAFVDAINQARYKLGFEFASDGEQWKWNRIVKKGDRKQELFTIKMNKPGCPQLNISVKPNQECMVDVLSAFDQTCIMNGYDIRKKLPLDLRESFTGDKWISMLNPLRDQDAEAYNVKTWLRQTDRCLKYAGRGIDTSLCAKSYIDMINSVVNKGALFESDKAKAFYEETAKEFAAVADKMSAWLKEEYEIDYR